MNSSADDADGTTTHAANEAKSRAFRLAVSSIDPRASLPGQVFQASWTKFLFFEADRVFVPEFAATATALLRVESANIACLLNLTRMPAEG